MVTLPDGARREVSVGEYLNHVDDWVPDIGITRGTNMNEVRQYIKAAYPAPGIE